MGDRPDVTKNLVEQYRTTSYLTRLYGHMLYFISGLHRLPKTARIIDCACGGGALIEVLQARGFHAIDGFDASVDMVELSRSITGIDIKRMEARDMASNYPHDSFDAVCISGMLHHLEDQEEFDKFLFGCRDLLKSGGLVVIREPHPTLLMRTFTMMSRHGIFYIGFLTSRLNSIVIEHELLTQFYHRWVGQHSQVLARYGLTETRAINWFESRIVVARKQ